MIEFRKQSSDELWKVLGAIVHKEDLHILVQMWFNNGYEFRINNVVYSEYSIEFEQVLIWNRLQQ